MPNFSFEDAAAFANNNSNLFQQWFMQKFNELSTKTPAEIFAYMREKFNEIKTNFKNKYNMFNDQAHTDYIRPIFVQANAVYAATTIPRVGTVIKNTVYIGLKSMLTQPILENVLETILKATYILPTFNPFGIFTWARQNIASLLINPPQEVLQNRLEIAESKLNSLIADNFNDTLKNIENERLAFNVANTPQTTMPASDTTVDQAAAATVVFNRAIDRTTELLNGRVGQTFLNFYNSAFTQQKNELEFIVEDEPNPSNLFGDFYIPVVIKNPSYRS